MIKILVHTMKSNLCLALVLLLAQQTFSAPPKYIHAFSIRIKNQIAAHENQDTYERIIREETLLGRCESRGYRYINITFNKEGHIVKPAPIHPRPPGEIEVNQIGREDECLELKGYNVSSSNDSSCNYILYYICEETM